MTLWLKIRGVEALLDRYEPSKSLRSIIAATLFLGEPYVHHKHVYRPYKRELMGRQARAREI